MRRGARPFQLCRCNSRVLQLLNLLQKLIGAIELAGYKGILRCALYLGDLWAVGGARCGLNQRFLVVSGNLEQFFAQPVDRYLVLTEGCKKCSERVFVDSEIVLECINLLLLLVRKRPAGCCRRFYDSWQSLGWNADCDRAVLDVASPSHPARRRNL